MNSGSFFDNFTGSRIITDTPHSNSSMLSGAISHLRMITSPMVKSTMNSPSLCLALTGNEEIDRIRGELEGVKGRDDEYESRSGSDNIDGGSGDDQDLENPPKRKRYHRHTPQQIQELEALFKECPHPDEKQRLELGRRLNLEPRQVKFWFQNRRTQMKTQLERHENSILRQENDKLRAENLSIRDAIRNPVCSHCGGPAVLGELSLEEQQLRIENARLRDELERVCALTGKFMTHPILTSSHHVSNSSLDLTIKDDGFGGSASDYGSTPSQLSLVSTTKSSSVSCTDHTERSLERSMFLELALAAMDELVKLVQMDEPIWMPGLDDGMDVLNFEEYTKMFPRCIDAKPVGFVSEATRETGMVIISSLALIETLMDGHRWLEMFPGLVVRSSVTEVVSSGVGGTKNGAIQLMHAEFQVLSPLVPICEANFLRFSKQHAEGIWAVVDVSIDGIRETPVNSSYMGCRRLPSGCLVQSMPNGYTKVTCVEHREYDESQVHHLYRSYLLSGKGFGAGRWLSTLQRHCQFLATFISPTNDSSVVSLTGRRNLLKLAQRMMSIFCGGVCASPDQKWSKLCIGNVGDDVRVMTRKSVDNPGEPSGVILNAATSVWLPGETEHLFDFLRNDGLRSQWDILSNGGPMHKMANIPKGHDQRNCVSLLRSNAMSATQNSMLILQETCIDAAGSLVIYAPVDVPAMNAVMNGGDPSFVALLPSGFAIVPACERSSTNTNICPATGMSGSLLTVAFQILVNSLPTAKLTVESVETVNNLISCTIQKIKAALQCDT